VDRGAGAAARFDRIEVGLQLAEAFLRAGRHDPARDLFERIRSEARGGAAGLTPATELRVTAGYAEALFSAGAFELALPEFNRLATRLPADDPRRWSALLRDLQCRAALNHPPEGIIKVIEQQRFLYPGLGGPDLLPQFDKLERESQRRRDEKR
jgi:hypothetical protein